MTKRNEGDKLPDIDTYLNKDQAMKQRTQKDINNGNQKTFDEYSD